MGGLPFYRKTFMAFHFFETLHWIRRIRLINVPARDSLVAVTANGPTHYPAKRSMKDTRVMSMVLLTQGARRITRNVASEAN